jgi:hypothetical protein
MTAGGIEKVYFLRLAAGSVAFHFFKDEEDLCTKSISLQF